MAHITRMIGPMILNGTRRMAANSGTQVSTTIRPTTLPRYMLAIRPQTKSFCSTNSRGAGGVRRGLRRHHALDLALAEVLAPFGHTLGDAVAHERGRCGPGGRNSHPAADQAGAQRRGPVGGQLLP